MVTPAPAPTATSFAPQVSACRLLLGVANATAEDIFKQHGLGRSCDSGPPIILQVSGRVPSGTPAPPGQVPPGEPAADARPGFLVCVRPANATGPYCGVEPDHPDATHSYLSNWAFYPFPAADADEVGLTVYPQEYQCIGNATELWTFHLDTYTYTPGCTVPPPEAGSVNRPCDVFLYIITPTTRLIFDKNGTAAACGLFDNGETVVGVVNGRPAPGVVTCAGAPQGSTGEEVSRYCGLVTGEPAVPAVSSQWTFTALPVASGPVTGATFDLAKGTACISVGGQQFTFDVKAGTVTSGC